MANNKIVFSKCYCIFGLKVTSELPLPCSIKVLSVPDVIIALRKIPTKYIKKIDQAYYWKTTEKYFFLDVKGVARYLVKEGRSIDVESYPECKPEQMIIYLVGTCFGMLLHQRAIFPFHASAIKTEQGCILFSGPRGVGKSTLAAAFDSCGYPVLVDDVCPIFFNRKNKPYLFPGMSQLKLCSDSAEQLAIETEGCSTVKTGKLKYYIPTKSEFSYKMQIHSIYFLQPWTGKEIIVQQLKGIEKVEKITQNIFRLQMIAGLEMQQYVFNCATHLAQKISSYTISRPVSLSSLKRLVENIKQHFSR